MNDKSQRKPRRIKRLALALVASAAMSALAVSSASALSVTWTGGGTTKTFGQQEGTSSTFSTETGSVTCSGLGQKTGGFSQSEGQQQTWLTLVLTGCKEKYTGFGFYCNSSGWQKGEVILHLISYRLDYLDSAKTQFGMVFGANESGVVAQFKCPGYGELKWTGSVLAQVTSPAFNVASREVKFQFNHGTPIYTQEYEQVEGAGSKYHLSQQFNNGAVQPMSMTFGLTAKTNFAEELFTFHP